MQEDERWLTLQLRAAKVQIAWESSERRLLIFDNLEDAELLELWRPRGGGCRVLITTRDQTWSTHSGVRTLPLAPLAELAATLDKGEWLLLGVGLVVDPEIVVPAYDDAAGVTAEFDRNVLHVLNHRLGANFEPDRFRHVALWDADNEWIEMRLEATAAMTVQIPGLDLEVSFDEGEQLRTEISAKFRLDGIARELTDAGFVVRHEWVDPDDRFALIGASRR